MIKKFFIAVSLVLVVVWETSGLSSLPEPIKFFPLVLPLAIYLIQFRSLLIGVYWLVGYGLYIDYLSRSVDFFPEETIIQLIVGTVVWLIARRLFTNRSLYSLIGCGLLALVLQHGLRAVVWLGQFWVQTDMSVILVWGKFLFWQTIGMILVLSFLVYAGGRLKKIFDAHVF